MTDAPSRAKRTMTLNLSDAEMDFVERRASDCELSKTAIIRAALRLYQLTLHRLAAGETMTWSGERERIAMFVGPGFEPAEAVLGGSSQQGKAND